MELVRSYEVRKKYQLPLVKKIPRKFFNIPLLVSELQRLESYWTDIYRANQGLCAAHLKLAEDNYKHFDQINLTTFEQSKNNLSLEEARLECQSLSKLTRAQFGSLSEYRAKTRQKDNINPSLDEHRWHVPLPIYQGSIIQKEIQKNFSTQPIRVRLVRLQAGKALTPHIDYCPTYAIRVIVPLITDAAVKNIFWKKSVRHEFHLPADGGAYFLNVGFTHSVENSSQRDRYSLMFSLPNQDDIQCL